MKNVFMAMVVLCAVGFAQAEETTSEKVGATVNDAKRSVQKTGHRISEKLCAKGDLECARQKVENRAEEAGDYAKDKTKEMKNKIDSDKK